MTSIRHGLHLLQRLDVRQHDWYSGQFLCRRVDATDSAIPIESRGHPEALVHAFFVDFSATYQTTNTNYRFAVDDYGRCVQSIGDTETTGLDLKWVCDYWDKEHMKREEWDTGSTLITDPPFVKEPDFR